MNLLYRRTLRKGLTSLSFHYTFLKVVIIILNPLGYSEDSVCTTPKMLLVVLLRRMQWCTFATRGSSTTNQLRLKFFKAAAIPARRAGILQIIWRDD